MEKFIMSIFLIFLLSSPLIIQGAEHTQRITEFDQLINVFIAIVSAFAAIVAVTITFALWDRRTMIRPFETKIKVMESDIFEDRKKIQSLLDSLQAIAKTNEKIAEVLRRFNLF